METLGASPFVWLSFDESGTIDAAAVQTLNSQLQNADIEDVVVMSHGWKNDETDAKLLYGELWAHTCARLPSGKPTRILVAGVLWPAKAFETDFDTAALVSAPSGGALSTNTAVARTDLSDSQFDAALRAFADLLGTRAAATVDAARAAAKDLSDLNAFELVEKAANLVGANSAVKDRELQHDAAPIARVLKTPSDAQLMLDGLKSPPQLNVTPGVGRAQSVGSVVRGVIDGPRAAVARFLNQLTYYEMKSRAGIVGAALSARVLRALSASRQVRLHLVGHSFGARLVTAAANEFQPTETLSFYSLALLQGAFSHNALAKAVTPGVPGAFPDVVAKPKGPIVITHTHNDLACTFWYALASRLARDTTKGIGDASDEFGAMGANGPQKLDAGASMPDDTTRRFLPQRGKVNPILADAFILKTETSDAHNNVHNAECGRLFAATLLS